MTATVALTALSFALTALLVFIYARLAVRVRASFPIGLTVLASLFLIQNAVALYQYATMMDYLAPGLEPFALAFAALQAAAFTLMLWLATR
jgi:hypothetical protein